MAAHEKTEAACDPNAAELPHQVPAVSSPQTHDSPNEKPGSELPGFS